MAQIVEVQIPDAHTGAQTLPGEPKGIRGHWHYAIRIDSLEGFQGRYGAVAHRDGARMPVLALCQIETAPREIHVSPWQPVEFVATHAGFYGQLHGMVVVGESRCDAPAKGRLSSSPVKAQFSGASFFGFRMPATRLIDSGMRQATYATSRIEAEVPLL